MRRVAVLTQHLTNSEGTPSDTGKAKPVESQLENLMDKHYNTKVTEAYHNSFFYSGDYEQWQLEIISKSLNLRPSDRFVDLGGGTGRFAQLLSDKHCLTEKVLCVDPSSGMLEQARALKGVDTLEMDAALYAQDVTQRYDCILLKEMVHHVDDVKSLYAGISSQLAPGGRCVTCTRPRVTEYPFFDAAIAVWEKHQPDVHLYVDAIQAAGLQVNVIEGKYPAKMSAEAWESIVANRIWSTFSGFTNAELTAGINEIRKKFVRSDGQISFTEKYLIIVALKPES